jgi:ligand-binding SRPBCC domain-containing protein
MPFDRRRIHGQNGRSPVGAVIIRGAGLPIRHAGSVESEGSMRFEKETRIAASPDAVFAFHESPGALERLTPPWEQVRRIEGGDSLRPGTRVVLAIPFGPLRLRWVAEHTEYEAGRMFADRQVQGPFAAWYHRHLFLDDGRGGTVLRDEVDYEPPLGVLGRWVAGGFLEAKLRKLFDYRHETTRRLVESGDVSHPGPAVEDPTADPPRIRAGHRP